MKELLEILSAARPLRERGEAAVLATVVEVRGSTYRRTGARLLLSEHGWVAGGVSGGCLEGDILRKAWWRTQASGHALVTYDSTIEDDEEMAWGLGLGCNGVVRVLLERLPGDETEAETETEPEPESFAFLRRCLASRQEGAYATIYESSGDSDWVGQRFWCGISETGATFADAALQSRMRRDARTVLAERVSRNCLYLLEDGGTVSVFWEAIIPPTPLVIYGAGHDTLPVIRLAKELGWHVTVADPRAPGAAIGYEEALMRRFPGADAVIAGPPEVLAQHISFDANTAVLLMTHQYFDDLALLPAVLRSAACYVGVLGPRKRAERLLAELARRGENVAPDALRKLHAPVGLDIGADTPEEIALSAISEIKAVLTGRSGGPLRGQGGTIHARAGAEENSPLPATEKVTCLRTAK
ncbi:MAG: XdhC family protein [Cytophagales bacterium]|nr:XdhC family protein [Armatimonadota bacterium]